MADVQAESGPLEALEASREQVADLLELVEIEREQHAAALARVWDEGFTRGFYDPLAGGPRDASESAATNPYERAEKTDA